MAAALTVVASFAAPSAASAAGSGAAANTPGAGRPQPARHAKPADGAHGPKTVVKKATANSTVRPAHTISTGSRPTVTLPAYNRPSRPAKPAARVRPTVKLWRGTPSYTVPTGTSTPASPNLTFTAACTKSGNIAAPFTWSPATCPNGYKIAADATVPKGKTLTINPGTVVYVDTTVGGAPVSGDPSDHVDLKVNGTLKVAGTSANPVTLTSLNATPDSSVEPQAGDWGYVFFNHVNGQLGGGSLDHLRLLYGQGIAADRSRPAITNSVVTNVAGGTNAVQQTSITESRGIDYENVPSGNVNFTNLTYDGAATTGIQVESVYNHGSFDGSNKSGNRFTFILKNSHITGGATGVDTIYVASLVDGASAATNNAGVKLMVTGNHITNPGNDYALDVSVQTPSATVPGTTYVTGAVTGNTVLGSDASYGLYFDVEPNDSKKVGTTACSGVSACIILPFQRNRISVYGEAIYNYIWIHAGTGHALISEPFGKKTKKTVIPGGRYESDDNDTIDSYIYNYGSGNAAATLPMIKTTNNSYDIGLYSYVEAYRGNATNLASVTGSTWVSYDEYNIEQDTYGSNNTAPPTGVAGASTSRSTVTNSSFTAYDYNLYTDYTQSGYGPASNAQHVSGSTLTSNDDYNVYNYVYGSKTGGSGGATNLLDVRGTTASAYYGLVYNDVYAYNGNAPATSTVNLINSKAWAYDEDVIDNYAYASQNAASHGLATGNVNITGSKVISYYDGIYNYASSNYGGAAGSPRIVNSELTSSDDYGIENYIYGTNSGGSHSVTGSPFIKNSTINTYYDPIYNEVYGYYGTGNATGNPYIQGSTVVVGDDDAIYNYVQSPNQAGGGGSATANPKILGSNVVAYDYLIDNEASSDFGAGTANPVIRNSTVMSGDDYGIYNYAYGSQTAGSGAATANPVIDSSTMHTYDYGIYNEASSEGGASFANPLINKSNVICADDEVIYNYSYASNSRNSKTATGNPRVVDSKVHAYYDIIENYVYGERGPAIGNPVILRSKVVATDDYGIYNYVYADYATATSGHTATAKPRIDTSVVTSYYDAIENYAYGERGNAIANPTITGSTVNVSDDYGIDNYAYADYNNDTAGHTGTANPQVLGSTINAYYYDVYNYAYGYQGPAVANPLVRNSVMSSNDDYGVYNNAYGSNQSGTGSATANPIIDKSSISAYDDALYNYAETRQGKTVTSPQILGSKLKTLFGYVLYNEGYAGSAGGTASATGNPLFRNSTGFAEGSSDTAFYNYQYSYHGAATANPVVTGSRLVSADSGYGIENYAYSAQTDSAGASVAHPMITGSKITSYEDALYNEASSGNGNSLADGSFNVVGSRLVSLEYDGIYSQAYSSGTSLSKVIPTVTNSVIRSPDDDGIDMYANPSGTGPAHIGGTITGSSLTGEGDMVYADAGGTGIGPSLFDTVIKTSTLVSTDSDGIYADYTVNGNALTIAPTVLDSHIVAVADYAMDLEAFGWANTGNALKVAPIVKRTPMNSYYGVYLYASDTIGSAQPGRSLVAGSISNSNIVSNDYYGVYAEARCDYCTDSARSAVSVTNTPINSLDEALYQYAYSTANSGTAPASIGGGLTSTKRSGVTVNDAYGVYGYADSRTGNASSTLHVTGLALTSYYGAIYHYVNSATGTATSNAVLSNNVLTPLATGSYSVIYDQANASTTATMNDAINRNVISDFGNSSNNAIEVYLHGATNVSGLTIAHNAITNVGGYGIYAYTTTGAPATGALTLDHNTVVRTGFTGFWLYGFKAIITGNLQSSANRGDGTGNSLDGIYVYGAPAGGSITCNVISNDAVGIEFETNAGNPVIHQNSFVPLTSSVRNSKDIKSDSSTNATNNFFHGNPRKAGAGPINTTPKLSAIPNCAKTAGA